jgi:hypothetical protein
MWVVVVALVAVPLLVAEAGTRIGFAAFEVAVLAQVATLGPVFVLAWRLTRWAGVPGVPQPSGYLQWVALGGPTLLVALIGILAHTLPARRPAGVPAVGRCERCAEAYSRI